MSFTVFLGNLPVWVTADDIKSWLSSESLVADAIKVLPIPPGVPFDIARD